MNSTITTCSSSLSRKIGLVALAVACLLTRAASAQTPPPPPPPPAPQALPPAPGPQEIPVAAAASSPTEDPEDAVKFGVAFRTRYISIPGWVLGLFTQANVPLNSYHIGGEFFRRKGDLDIVLGVGYQSMSPPDGNWLARGKPPEIDTDFISFRGFGLVGVDLSFTWHTRISEYFGLHYGAGLGLAVVTGSMLRISTGSPGCKMAPGDTSKCFPIICTAAGCDEQELKKSETGPDNGPQEPHRFKEPNVPGAVPIVNVLAGMNFRIPDAKGLEFKLEGGFYNAFFFGGGIGYTF